MDPLAELHGESAAIVEVRSKVRRFLQRQSTGRRPLPVLIQGETGTGKGLLAQAMHRASARAHGPFVDLSCAAIPETLLEAELFGYERGAFTDARQAKPGLVQSAHGGTLFLDEIGLMASGPQAKLLKAIEEQTVRRLGSTRAEPVDAWIIAATSEHLAHAMRDQRFRADLYHRLAVFMITLPPLRDRGDDIVLLAEHFTGRASAVFGLPRPPLRADVIDGLRSYAWPGNVRELANTMERIVLMADDGPVTAEMLELGEEPDAKRAPASTPARTRAPSLDQTIREYLQNVLDDTGGNITRAAIMLGIARNTMRAHIQRLGLGVGPARSTTPLRTKRRERYEAAAPRPSGSPPAEDAPVSRVASLRWERRLVTFVAVSLTPPSDVPAFRFGPLLQDAVVKARSFSARIEELSPLRMVAAFGFEPIEDPPVRAARAGLAMLRAIERDRDAAALGLSAKIAIHAADHLLAVDSDVTGMDVRERGQTWATLEHLLEHAAPNTIAIDTASARLLERRFAVELSRRGASPSVYRVLRGERSGFEVGGRLPTRFVGRDRDLDTLRHLLAEAEAGRGQAVGMLGEPGVGKSRLLSEFRRSLAREQVTYVAGRCFTHGAAIPYLPIVEIVRHSFGIPEPASAEVAMQKLAAGLETLGLEPAGSATYLLHLLGHRDVEVIGTVTPEAVRARIMTLLRQLTVASSQRKPLVIAVEDLQWIDATSQEALTMLADALAGYRILLVVTYRPGYQPPWLGRSYASQMVLHPLADPESLAVLQSVAPELTSDVCRAVVARADGIPFFLEELARQSVEHAGTHGALTLPTTVQAVLAARIDRLPPEEKRLLETAAVIGDEFPLDLLEAIAEESPESVIRRLVHLQAAEFLRETRVFPAAEYRFKHVLTHQVAYDRQLQERRRMLHGRIVEVLEATDGERRVHHVARLAHHAVGGEMWTKAVAYSKEAGVQAVARYANNEAVAFFEQALAGLGRLPQTRETMQQAIDLRLSLRASLFSLGHLPMILSHLQEAQRLAEAIDDRRRLGWVAVYMTHFFMVAGNAAHACTLGEQAQAIAATLDDLTLAVFANVYEGAALVVSGDCTQAQTPLRAAIGLVEGDAYEQRLGAVIASSYLACALAEHGDFVAEAAHHDRWIQIAEGFQDPYPLAFLCWNLGHFWTLRGDFTRAMSLLERGLALCGEPAVSGPTSQVSSLPWQYVSTYLRVLSPVIRGALGYASVLGGHLSRGLTILDEAVRATESLGIAACHSILVVRLGEATLLAGNVDDALGLATRGLELTRERGQRGYEAWALLLLGDIEARRETPSAAQAERRYHEALALGSDLGMRPFVAHCHAALAHHRARRGEWGLAQAHFATATAMYREIGMTYWLEKAEADFREPA